MENQEYITISLEDLFSDYEDYRNGHSKNTTILKSLISIISIIASSTLICMIVRSFKGLSTTQHRILLGFCISDIFFSLTSSLFNCMAPRDSSYMVWNAQGNVATCNLQGYFRIFGACSGLFYNCSLNLYYLAVVKFEKTDKYIRAKLEPFFHGVPIILGLIASNILVANKNINDNLGGSCYAPIYDPPHCKGYGYGEILNGFEIPCGRGHDGFVLFSYTYFFITTFIPPIIISISFWLIYRAVLDLEKKTTRYGANVFRNSIIMRSSIIEENNNTGSEQLSNQIRSRQTRLKTRAIMNRAMGYSIAYFLAWGFTIVGIILDIAGLEWPTIIWYIVAITNPAQGLFTFLTFLHPKVLNIMKIENGSISWYQAFVKALCSRGNDNRRGRRARVYRGIEGTSGIFGTIQRDEDIIINNQGDMPNFIETQRIIEQHHDGGCQDMNAILKEIQKFDDENGTDREGEVNFAAITNKIQKDTDDQVAMKKEEDKILEESTNNEDKDNSN